MKRSSSNCRDRQSESSGSKSSRAPLPTALIDRARHGSKSSLGSLLQQYRNYLVVLAAMQIEKRLQPRVSPSDVVQETMLRAHKNFGQFRGTTEPELLAWLRQILVNNLAKFVEQHMLAARRDVRREVSIERIGAALEQSTIQLAALVPAATKSPSMAVQQREEAVVLADRLGAACRTIIARCLSCAICRDCRSKKLRGDRPIGRCDAHAMAAGDREVADGLSQGGIERGLS